MAFAYKFNLKNKIAEFGGAIRLRINVLSPMNIIEE